MKEFIIKLITANSGISSKRFLSLFFALIFAGVVICSLFGIIAPDIIIYSLVGLIGGGQAMTLIQK
jgi:hypothetical protein